MEGEIRMLFQGGGDVRDMNREINYGVNNTDLYSVHDNLQH